MADLMLKTDKGTFNAFGGPNVNCVAIPYGSKTIYLHAKDGAIMASKDAPEDAAEDVPEIPQRGTPPEPKAPADADNAAVEGDDVA